MAGPLYNHIIALVRELEPDIKEREEREVPQETNSGVNDYAAYLPGQLYGFSDERAAEVTLVLRQWPDFLDGQFKDVYVRDMLDRVPKMVARTRRLANIISCKNPSQATKVFLTGATRTFVFGFWDASVALSRAALEQGLWELVKKEIKQKPNTLRELVKLSFLYRILDKANAELADRVVSVGNRVPHGKPSDEREAWDVLCAVRGVLLHLFAAE